MEHTSKEIKVIKAIRNKENEMWQKVIWCNEHDFPLEEQKFRYAEIILISCSRSLNLFLAIAANIHLFILYLVV